MPDYVLADAPTSASKDGDRKKTFEFRMSKKVAELTQVVHMLFTRNHEKEVELEALRAAYEHEIELVLNDANEHIANLDKQLKALEKAKSTEQTKAAMEKIVRREEEWRLRVAALEKQVADEKKECQNARDLLIQAERDLEKLRQGQADETARKNRELDGKSREVERLKQQVCGLERRLRDAEMNANSGLLELKRENEKLKRDMATVHGNLAESEKMREQFSAQNKQLESEIRTLKKELVRRSDQRSSAGSRPEFKDPTPIPDYMEELERLRREVQRYRNELCNREENFNRMFTQQHPVVLDKRAGQLRYTVGGREPTFAVTAAYPAPHQLITSKSMIMGTSQVGGSRPGSGTEESDVMRGIPGSPRQSQTITARLPQLGLESRRQTTAGGARLAKPRPLTREMLSAKAGGHG